MQIVFLLLLSLFFASALGVRKPYVVYLGSHAHGRDATYADLERVAESHHNLLESFLGSQEKAKDALLYSYRRHINGFSALLEEEEVAAIAKHPDVVSVFLSRGYSLHTTHSWNFMLLEKNDTILSGSLWHLAQLGRDRIIGHLDTGVWPESESFNDRGYGTIPERWNGICTNDTHVAPVNCNRKLIGARYFKKTYESALGRSLDDSFNSARDYEGHGTHTLSTSGGEFVPNASLVGYPIGTAKGGSPQARVAAYKVCWPSIHYGGCYDGDILAAFETAIHDGVDVISVSLGGEATDYFDDGIAIGAFHAVKNGITVVASAGNSGPVAESVSNVAPWMITVGASTIDREFQSFVVLGNGKRLKGASLSRALKEDKMYPLVSAADAKLPNVSAFDAFLCKKGTLDPKKVKGKILACLRGETARVDKGYQAALAGAVGMILCNDISTGDDIVSDPHFIPATQVGYKDGETILKYINSTSHPVGYITPTVSVMGTKPAPAMAAFSSRGPNPVTPSILKPDVTAPGVNIIAAFTEAVGPTELAFDHRRSQFSILSGTSMSCPHVAGLVGLLKSYYPNWSPAAIRSAIMTTARTRDNTMNPMLDGSTSQKATPFDYGSGHIRPNAAMNPGLVYDLTTGDYLDFLCATGYNSTLIKALTDDPYVCPQSANLLDFNYPSMTVPNLSGPVTLTRRVKNVGLPSVYYVRVREPKGVSIMVEPRQLNFTKIGEEKRFQMTIQPKWKSIPNGYLFGAIMWVDGKHYVRSPVVVSSGVSGRL